MPYLFKVKHEALINKIFPVVSFNSLYSRRCFSLFNFHQPSIEKICSTGREAIRFIVDWNRERESLSVANINLRAGPFRSSVSIIRAMRNLPFVWYPNIASTRVTRLVDVLLIDNSELLSNFISALCKRNVFRAWLVELNRRDVSS